MSLEVLDVHFDCVGSRNLIGGGVLVATAFSLYLWTCGDLQAL